MRKIKIDYSYLGENAKELIPYLSFVWNLVLRDSSPRARAHGHDSSVEKNVLSN